MAFFKTTSDQLKANSFVSNLELAKTKFRSNDLSATKSHIKSAFEAMEKMKKAKAGYIISREGWYYVIGLCEELSNALEEVAQYRLSRICFFMYNWALWNEDQIGEGGMMTKVRSASLPPEERHSAGNQHAPEPEYTEDDAETRIQAALDKQAVELDLSDLELTELPEMLAGFTGLQYLVLVRNRLTSLPHWINKLINLQNIDLSGNQITSLPESLGKLTNLKILSICYTQLANLPEGLGKLTGLHKLYIHCNRLTSLPESLGNLIYLQMLSLGYNQFTNLPESLCKLTGLQDLNLENNLLTSLPEWIGKLINLQDLNLSDNKLTNLPESLGDLNQLRSLAVSGNPLIGSLESFGKLAKLLENQL